MTKFWAIFKLHYVMSSADVCDNTYMLGKIFVRGI